MIGTRILGACAGLAACAALAGCGSSGPKKPAKPPVDPLIAKTATPDATVKLLYGEIVKEQTAAACQLLTPAGDRQFVKRVGGIFKLTNCKAVAFQIAGFARGSRFGKVRQHGDSATIRVLLGGAAPVVVTLVKTPAGWRVAGFKT